MLSDLMMDKAITTQVRQQLQDFLNNGGEAQTGKGLYPQYYPPGFGMLDSSEGPRRPEPYPRLVFNLIGQQSLDITLPISEKPHGFPNAADVLVLYCPSNESRPPDPLAVAVFKPNGSVNSVFLRSPFPGHLSCPFPSNP